MRQVENKYPNGVDLASMTTGVRLIIKSSGSEYFTGDYYPTRLACSWQEVFRELWYADKFE